MMFFFFFSSRRRHTRFDCDWSSDVCSSDLTGGTLIQLETTQPVGTERIRSALDAAGIRDAEIQQFGGANEYKVQARLGTTAALTQGSTDSTAQAVDSALAHGLGPHQYTIVRTEAAGPQVGRELQGKAFPAILVSVIVTLIYLAVRVGLRVGPPPPPAAPPARLPALP